MNTYEGNARGNEQIKCVRTSESAAVGEDVNGNRDNNVMNSEQTQRIVNPSNQAQ